MKNKKEPEVSVMTEAPVKETKFPVSRLREKCLELFGVTVSTFDGAAHGLDGEYTVSEMRTAISAWQNRRAK
ncbi:MAG: hypothetical protein ACI4I9_04645 [Porcipelethomonas sp.]